MSTTPAKYQPSPRVIEQPQRLTEMYCVEDMSIREIADHPDVAVGKTKVSQALREHDIVPRDSSSDVTQSGNRGSDPPAESTNTINWSALY